MVLEVVMEVPFPLSQRQLFLFLQEYLTKSGHFWSAFYSYSLTLKGFFMSILCILPDDRFLSPHIIEMIQENRKRQETPEFRAIYAKRAGVEGTVAQAVRTCKMRRSRYIGQKKLNL